ncbi:MAG: hypothetical protein WCS88_03725 [Patescibacteria group bacterium]|jgi:peptidoglycan/LPS O-acetylase OafA/YrhL
MHGRKISLIKKFFYIIILFILGIFLSFEKKNDSSPFQQFFGIGVLAWFLLLGLLVREFLRKNFETVKWLRSTKIALLILFLVTLILAFIYSYYVL